MKNEELLPYFARFERLMRFYADRDTLIYELAKLNLDINSLFNQTALSSNQRVAMALLQDWIGKRCVLKDINSLLDKYLGCNIDCKDNISKISGYETYFEKDLYGNRIYYDIITFKCGKDKKTVSKVIGERLIVFYEPGGHNKVSIGNEQFLAKTVRVYGYENGYVTSIPYTKRAMDFLLRRVRA